MRRPPALLTTLLLAALAACGGTEPINDPRLLGEVHDRFDAWVKAWNNHSATGLEPFYLHASDLTFSWPDGERTRGWTEESRFQQQYLPTVTLMNLVPRDPVVLLVRKNLALVSFAFSLDLTTGDTRQIGPGQGIMLWQQGDGGWQIYAAQLSYSKAVQSKVAPRQP